MSDDTPLTLAELFGDLPAQATTRYTVRVTLNRDPRDTEPPVEGHALASFAAVLLSARALVTEWLSERSCLSMIVDAPDEAEAIRSGAAVVGVLGYGRGAAVEVEPIARSARLA
jgi:hypothetical protein